MQQIYRTYTERPALLLWKIRPHFKTYELERIRILVIDLEETRKE
jgi:hypothetical protein